MSTVLRSVPFNTAVQAAGRLLVMALGLVSVALTSRYLGQAAYGDLTTVVVYVSFFSVLAELGLSSIAIREMSSAPERVETIVGNVLSIRMLLSTVAALVAAGGIALSPYPTSVKLGVAIATLSIPFVSAWLTLASVFQARLEMASVALVEVASRAVALVLTVTVIAFDGGFQAVVAATVAWSLAGAALMFGLGRRVVRVAFLAELPYWRELVREALPLGAAGFLSAVYLRIDTILLSLLRGSADVGTYGIAYKVFELLLALPGFFAISFFPLLSRAASHDRGQLPVMMQRAFDLVLLGALPVAAGGSLVAPGLVRLLGGPEFGDAGLPLAILLLGAAFAFENTLLSYALVALRRQRELLWLGIAGLTGNVLVNLALIPRFGPAGAAATASAGAAAMFLALVYRVRRGCGFAPSAGTASRATLATGAMFLVLLPLTSAHPLVVVGVGAVVYLTSLYFLGALSRERLMLSPGA